MEIFWCFMCPTSHDKSCAPPLAMAKPLMKLPQNLAAWKNTSPKVSRLCVQNKCVYIYYPQQQQQQQQQPQQQQQQQQQQQPQQQQQQQQPQQRQRQRQQQQQQQPQQQQQRQRQQQQQCSGEKRLMDSTAVGWSTAGSKTWSPPAMPTSPALNSWWSWPILHWIIMVEMRGLEM